MGKLSHKIWVKVICLLIIAIFLFNQNAYARHYTPNESMKNFFKSDADQAAMYVVGVALSIVLPGVVMPELLTSTSTLGQIARLGESAMTMEAAQQAITQSVIIGAAVNMGSQVAVACGADSKTTMIVGGVVGGLASGFSNLGSLSSSATTAQWIWTVAQPTLVWTASATASAYAGEKNPVLGSFAGIAAGALVSGGLYPVGKALGVYTSVSGGAYTETDKQSLEATAGRNYIKNEHGTLSADLKFTTSELNAPVIINGEVNNVPITVVADVGSNPGQSPIMDASSIKIIEVNGQAIDPSKVSFANPILVREQINNILNNNFLPKDVVNVQGASAAINRVGPPAVAVTGKLLWNMDPISAALRNLQTLGPGIIAETAVKWALYEAVGGKKNKQPWVGPVITMPGSITGALVGALVNEGFGGLYASLGSDSVSKNPWGRPQNMNFGQYMGRLVLTELFRTGISTGFKYLEANIKSNSFPGTTQLLTQTGEFFVGTLATSLVDSVWPTTPQFRRELIDAKLEKPTFAKIFNENLKTNFNEALFNTLPYYAALPGLHATYEYLNYIQNQLNLNVTTIPFINVAFAFGDTLSKQAINSFGQSTGYLLSNPFMPPEHKWYLAAASVNLSKSEQPPQWTEPRILRYHSIDNEKELELQERKAVPEVTLDAVWEFGKNAFALIQNREEMSPEIRESFLQEQQDRKRVAKLKEDKRWEGYLDVDTLAYSYALDTYNLAFVPQGQIGLRQERIFDIDRQLEKAVKIIARTDAGSVQLNRIIQESVIRADPNARQQLAEMINPALVSPTPEELDKILTQATPDQLKGVLSGNPELNKQYEAVKQAYTPKGELIGGVAVYDNKLTVGSFAPSDRWGRNLPTVYYRHASAAGIEQIPDKLTKYSYGIYGMPSLIITEDKVKGTKFFSLPWYEIGEVFGRGAPRRSIDILETNKGVKLSMMYFIPQVLNTIDASLSGLEGLKELVTYKFDEKKFSELWGTVTQFMKDKGITDITLQDVERNLPALVESERIKQKDANNLIRDLNYLAYQLAYQDKLPVSNPELNQILMPRREQIKDQIKNVKEMLPTIEQYLPGLSLGNVTTTDQFDNLIGQLTELKGRFYTTETRGEKSVQVPRDFALLRQTIFSYNLEAEARTGKFERSPVYEINTAFERSNGGLTPTFNLWAFYDYSQNPVDVQNAQSWANWAPKWFKESGQGLRGVKITLEGKELWFLKKEGSDKLYPAGYGSYLYHVPGGIPQELSNIFKVNEMLLPKNYDTLYIHNLAGVGDNPLLYFNAKSGPQFDQHNQPVTPSSTPAAPAPTSLPTTPPAPAPVSTPTPITTVSTTTTVATVLVADATNNPTIVNQQSNNSQIHSQETTGSTAILATGYQSSTVLSKDPITNIGQTESKVIK